MYKKGKIVQQAQTTIPKDIMVSGSSELFDQSLRRLSPKEAYTTKHRNSRFEIQSFGKNPEPAIPIVPFGIAAYLFTLFEINLSQNSCKQIKWRNTEETAGHRSHLLIEKSDKLITYLRMFSWK